MHRLHRAAVMAATTLSLAGVAAADVFETYESFAEGFLGTGFTSQGVTYRDANNVSGFFPDGAPFTPTDLGQQFIIEQADVIYTDFPSYGSPVNALTFGTSFIPGTNVTIGPLASVYMDLPELSNEASVDLVYYENGPWGNIEYTLAAELGGSVVATDSFLISDLGGRDNPAFRTLSISGVQFDTLHLFATLNGDYTAPRGIIDNLRTVAVPEPASVALLGLAAVGLLRRR